MTVEGCCDNFPVFHHGGRLFYRPPERGLALISLDSSIIAAIAVFIVLVYVLNRMLFQPLMRVQAERERRTTGIVEQSRAKLAQQLQLFEQYQTAIRNARTEGYRHQEKSRSEAMARRAQALGQARRNAETRIRESRESIQEQVRAVKEILVREAGEIARGIASTILQRSS